jgi:hypothetical protein
MSLRLPEWIHLDLVGRLFNALKDGNGEIHETAPWTMMLFNALKDGNGEIHETAPWTMMLFKAVALECHLCQLRNCSFGSMCDPEEVPGCKDLSWKTAR